MSFCILCGRELKDYTCDRCECMLEETVKTGLSAIVCAIPRLERMNLKEAVEQVLRETNAGEYTVDIPLNLPNADVKFVVFLPKLGNVMDVLTQLAENYGAKIEVIEYEKLIRFFPNNHFPSLRTFA